MAKRRIFDMGANLPRGDETFGVYQPLVLSKRKLVGEFLGAKIYEDPFVPRGEVHLADPITGCIVGRIVGIGDGNGEG